VLRGAAPIGAHGLAGWDSPTVLLAALRTRGIRVAALAGE
jgi:hypothetical protein